MGCAETGILARGRGREQRRESAPAKGLFHALSRKVQVVRDAPELRVIYGFYRLSWGKLGLARGIWSPSLNSMVRASYATLALSLALTASLSMAACGGNSQTNSGGNGGSGASGGGGGGGGGDQSGIPCEVAQVLADQCLSCHGSKLAGGAPMSLVTYEDLAATSSVDPAMTVAERSLVRMKSAGDPMPPGGAAAAAEIAALEAWIAADMPQEDCGSVVDPFAAPPGCQSGKQWNPEGKEGSLMNPGMACISCHQKEAAEEPEVPIFAVAGTVYPLGHETDYCYGVDGTSPDFAGVKVVVTDANGQAYTLDVGATGNFSLSKLGFAYPYTAKVVSPAGERVMNEAQQSGDCNLCHTATGGGNGSMAPGRIVVPL